MGGGKPGGQEAFPLPPPPQCQAVLGFWLEPWVTWMPGIPEPLGCSALAHPPAAPSLLHRCLAPFDPGGRAITKGDWDVEVGTPSRHFCIVLAWLHICPGTGP